MSKLRACALQKGEALLKAGHRSYVRKYRARSALYLIIGVSLIASLLPLPLPAQSVTPQDQSTASESAAQIDEAWQKASAKYDQQRDALLATVQKESMGGPFQPDWQSLAKYQAPDWYRDAKFGIFIHWGLYSVPAFGSEWYPREMYLEGSPINQHHVATYGPLTQFGYKDFIPMFKAEKFDPQAWATLFKESGAATLFRCSSTMMGSQCMTATSQTGQRRSWGRTGILWGNLQRQCARKECIWVHPHTALSMTGFSTVGASRLPM